MLLNLIKTVDQIYWIFFRALHNALWLCLAHQGYISNGGILKGSVIMLSSF